VIGDKSWSRQVWWINCFVAKSKACGISPYISPCGTLKEGSEGSERATDEDLTENMTERLLKIEGEAEIMEASEARR
jgi:hypothetical protein